MNKKEKRIVIEDHVKKIKIATSYDFLDKFDIKTEIASTQLNLSWDILIIPVKWIDKKLKSNVIKDIEIRTRLEKIGFILKGKNEIYWDKNKNPFIPQKPVNFYVHWDYKNEFWLLSLINNLEILDLETKEDRIVLIKDISKKQQTLDFLMDKKAISVKLIKDEFEFSSQLNVVDFIEKHGWRRYIALNDEEQLKVNNYARKHRSFITQMDKLGLSSFLKSKSRNIKGLFVNVEILM